MKLQKKIEDAQKVPNDFGLSSSHERYKEIIYEKTWSLGAIFRHRDSNLLELSNADALIKMLEEHKDIRKDWMIVECDHWACGWVEHLAFKIFDDIETKQPSKVFKLLKQFNNELADYPVADENDYSKREYEATVENIKDCANQFELKDNLPNDWPEQCWSWFWENNQSAIENKDGNGGYPTKEEMKNCLISLDLIVKEEEKEKEE